MGLIVDEDYYESVPLWYSTQVKSVEASLESFKTCCEEFYGKLDFGVFLQQVMIDIYNEFYSITKDKLSSVSSEVEQITSNFVDSIVLTDKL